MPEQPSLARTPRLELQLLESQLAQLIALQLVSVDRRLGRLPSAAIPEDPHDLAAIAIRMADPVKRATADELAAIALVKASGSDASLPAMHLHEARPLAKLAVLVALRYLAGRDGRS